MTTERLDPDQPAPPLEQGDHGDAPSEEVVAAIREARGQLALQETRAHAERARAETELRDDAIRRARAAGLPLRRIAHAASLSHMQIKNICDKKES